MPSALLIVNLGAPFRIRAGADKFRAFTGLTPNRSVEVQQRFLREDPGHALDSWPLPAD